MSQSAVSRQISALEDDLGLKLFIRHARGLVLTEVGEQLFRTAHRMHWELQQVETQMSESQDVPTGPLHRHHHGGYRLDLAVLAARRVPHALSADPARNPPQRRRARPRHARGRRGHPPASAQPVRDDPAQAVHGAQPLLRLQRLYRRARHAAQRRGARRSPHHQLRRAGAVLSRRHQLPRAHGPHRFQRRAAPRSRSTPSTA